ncbi:MAG: FxsA family protein [Solirubrobacterales bacterium]
MPLLLLLFIVLPILELLLVVRVHDWLGWLPTLGLLLFNSLAGAYLLSREGVAAWQRFQTRVSSGKVPHREVGDGVMIIVGGALLLTPGFITDIVGFLLLLPPTRAVLRRFVALALTKMVSGRAGVVIWGLNQARNREGSEDGPQSRPTGFTWQAGSSPGAGQADGDPVARRPGPSYDVDGEAEEVRPKGESGRELPDGSQTGER